jgi:hypothetical protein
MVKIVTTCVTCGEKHPDKLLFIDGDLQRVRVNTDLSRVELVDQIVDAQVMCWNCWRTKRRDNA